MEESGSLRYRAVRTLYLSLLGAGVSVCAALLTLAFVAILRAAHPYLFSLSGYPILFIAVPGIGLSAAQFVSRRWAHDIKGHGIPEIQYRVRDREGDIPLKGAGAKTLSSLITIAFGGSAGQAGPVALIGATTGSATGSLFRLSRKERNILIGAGVASAVTTLFHTPVAAVLFTLELILVEYSLAAVIPVLAATGVAFLGLSLAGFPIPLIPLQADILLSPALVTALAVTALLSAFIAWGWMKVQFAIETFFIRSRIPESLEALIAGLLVGTLSYLSILLSGEHVVSSADTEFLHHLLSGDISAPVLLMILLLLKFIANPLTLGAGGSGGVFAPSLFLGACAGVSIAGFAGQLFPLPPDAFIICALAGMSSVLAGVSGALLTSIVLSVEMTGDVSLLPLVALTAGLSYLINWLLNRDTLYSAKLKKEEAEESTEKQGGKVDVQ